MKASMAGRDAGPIARRNPVPNRARFAGHAVWKSAGLPAVGGTSRTRDNLVEIGIFP